MLFAVVAPTASGARTVSYPACTLPSAAPSDGAGTPARRELRPPELGPEQIYTGIVAIVEGTDDVYHHSQAMFQPQPLPAAVAEFSKLDAFRVFELPLDVGNGIKRLTEAQRAHAPRPGFDVIPQYFAATFVGRERSLTPEYRRIVVDCMGEDYLRRMIEDQSRADNRPYISIVRLTGFRRCPGNEIAGCAVGGHVTAPAPELKHYGKKQTFEGIVTLGGEPYFHDQPHARPPGTWDDDRVALTAIEIDVLRPLYEAQYQTSKSRAIFPSIFRVKLVGRRSLAPGVYGAVYRPTETRDGILVSRILSVAPCPFGMTQQACSTVSDNRNSQRRQ